MIQGFGLLSKCNGLNIGENRAKINDQLSSYQPRLYSSDKKIKISLIFNSVPRLILLSKQGVSYLFDLNLNLLIILLTVSIIYYTDLSLYCFMYTVKANQLKEVDSYQLSKITFCFFLSLRVLGLEPRAYGLKGHCSTTELHPLCYFLERMGFEPTVESINNPL